MEIHPSHLLEKRNNIRNICLIGNSFHGKTLIADNLIYQAGKIKQEEVGKGFLLSREDEKLRGITIKSSSISLAFKMDSNVLPSDCEGDQILVNLIDTPGHPDFFDEVASCVRVSDGSLLVIDCVEGVTTFTENCIIKSISELNVPVIMLNKMDRFISELALNEEEIYSSLNRTVENCNVIVCTYTDKLLGEINLNPCLNNVIFGSALHGWGFTLNNFASMYSEKFKIKKEKLVKYLWGDWYFDSINKVWVNSNKGGLKRGFCQFVIGPIKKVFEATMKVQSEKDLETILQKTKIFLSSEEKQKRSKALMKTVFSKWLPISNALLEPIANTFVSPVKAQSYRVSRIYDGNLDDIYANAIRDCDPSGPLMIYVTKMIPTSRNTTFVAFGRIFSGTIKKSEKVVIIEESGKRSETYLEPTLVMGDSTSMLESYPCGSTIGLHGTESFIVHKATITNDMEANCFKKNETNCFSSH